MQILNPRRAMVLTRAAKRRSLAVSRLPIAGKTGRRARSSSRSRNKENAVPTRTSTRAGRRKTLAVPSKPAVGRRVTRSMAKAMAAHSGKSQTSTSRSGRIRPPTRIAVSKPSVSKSTVAPTRKAPAARAPLGENRAVLNRARRARVRAPYSGTTRTSSRSKRPKTYVEIHARRKTLEQLTAPQPTVEQPQQKSDSKPNETSVRRRHRTRSVSRGRTGTPKPTLKTVDAQSPGRRSAPRTPITVRIHSGKSYAEQAQKSGEKLTSSPTALVKKVTPTRSKAVTRGSIHEGRHLVQAALWFAVIAFCIFWFTQVPTDVFDRCARSTTAWARVKLAGAEVWCSEARVQITQALKDAWTQLETAASVSRDWSTDAIDECIGYGEALFQQLGQWGIRVRVSAQRALDNALSCMSEGQKATGRVLRAAGDSLLRFGL